MTTTASLSIVRRRIDALREDPKNARLHARADGWRYASGVYEREVRCVDCGIEWTIRRHGRSHVPLRCRSCAGRIGGRAPKHAKKTGSHFTCVHCGTTVWRSPSMVRGEVFCKKKCHDDHRVRHGRESRACKRCGTAFIWNVKPYSNSRGIYCSRACRDAAALFHVNFGEEVDTDRPAHRRVMRANVARLGRKCEVCGEEKPRMHVHHIEGYDRATYDESETVAMLCPKHHSMMEMWTKFIRPFGAEKRKAEARAIRRLLDQRDTDVFFGEPRCLTR